MIPTLPSPAGEASIGTVPPVSFAASIAEKRRVSTQRWASTRAVLIGLPASAAIVAASSSSCSPTRSAAFSSAATRACWGKLAEEKASWATFAALSTSAASPFGTRPTTVPS